MTVNTLSISVPKFVLSNIEGYKLLSELLHNTKNLTDYKIILNFRENKWFEANLCAILGSIVHLLEKKRNTIEYVNLSTAVMNVFAKNSFLDGNNLTNKKITSRVMTYKKFKKDEESNFKDYIDRELLSIEELPTMSDLLKKKINKSIFEIFNNAFSHGKCECIFTCGQYFETKKRLNFTIVDLGKTIRSNVNKYLIHSNQSKLSSIKAIEWAVEEGNTTKTGDIPGGLGLSLIRDFLVLNKGKIQIVSAMGYWEQNQESIVDLLKINHKFEGTIVNLEFNLNDKNSYLLKEEIDPSTIF